MDDNISMFVGITGATPEVARGFLELASGDVQRAVELFFENPDLVSGVGAGAGQAAGTGAGASGPGGSRTNLGRQDAGGVIHIDSDDDEDMNYVDVDSDRDDDFNDDHAAATNVANQAQEDEDAAMAKRLQEELYSGGGGGGGQGSGMGGGGFGDDDVRAPIARTTETLVAPNPSWALGGGGGGDDGDDGAAAFLEQMRRRRPQPGRSGGPFSQSVWGDSSHPTRSTEDGTHARRLEDLFRPPYDLMTPADAWDDAREIGKADMKWLLVNLQDMNDFNCQALNRDIWKDQAVCELVKENFIFIQYDKSFGHAQEYITFYFPNHSHENPDNYPHVAIIDPRTGEQVKVWSGRPFPSASEFHAELAEFLDRYSLEVNSKNPVPKTAARKPQTVDVDRMTEEEMLDMALKNSMAGAEGPSRTNSNPNVHDPDALTKTPDPESTGDKGKEAEAASPFAQISSSNPHTEPDNNPATTTRIQFRHPNGRVIRRFNLQDPVRRLYEWLKAEPLEGKDGVEFELKQMPQGQDLLGSLESTVEESGLKQGTVMIEFIED